MKKQIEEKVLQKSYGFENIDCAICESQEFEILAEKDRYGLFFPVVVCRKCGLVQTNPRMTQEAYNEFYDKEYRRLYVGEHNPEKDFYNIQYPRGQKILEYLNENNVKLNKETPFVLEIGCGAGGVLQNFKEAGYKVQGIDLGREYLDYGREKHKLNLSSGSIHSLVLSEKPDLIIYSHVLEHVLDLKKELTAIKSICSNTTLVYIEVPSIKNLSHYHNDLLRYLQNAHTYHFSLTTLNNLFLSNGFVMNAGNEKVRALYSVGDNEKFIIKNDYNSVIEYLTLKERYITYLMFKNRTKFLITKMLSFMHLKEPIKKIFYRH
ncbi:MAG: class I SAM-dependent methyltransferase [Adhaeribacter sp.]